MPQMCGDESISLLKKNEITKNIPILVLTSVGSEEGISKFDGLGIIDILNKPISKFELLNAIKTICKIKK